ncbi:MAG: hypothetical protein EOM12_16600 [Verrucomicrobiae bacterium]|nr:hypothetical protein [Verrucomicrobiae bacterium]
MKVIIDGVEYIPAPIQKVELEDSNFRVNSDGWRKITVDGEEYLENEEKDIWEIHEGEYKGEQLFTWDSAIREAEKAGRRLPTIDELYEAEIENVKYVGYRNTDGKFDSRTTSTNFWSSSASGANAGSRYLYSGSVGVYRYIDSKANGFSVRCIASI